MAALLALVGFAAVGSAQMLGNVPEKNPTFITKQCTSAGCVAKNTFLTLDMFSRNITSMVDPTQSCPTHNTTQLLSFCNSTQACASTCQVQGANYEAAGVILSSSNSFGLRLLGKNSTGAMVSQNPKVYILDESGEKYTTLKLNTELTFDVDLSKVPCGAVSAVVSQEMDVSGFKSEMNPGGAKYGAGYCNSQCPADLTFVEGMANLNGSGVCCTQLDIFHSNSRATQASPHPCNPQGETLCSVAAGTCKGGANPICGSGCYMMPYYQGATNFYGKGKDFKVDTSRPFTVVTQFLANGSSAWGGMKRMYIQDGKLIENFIANGSTTSTVIQPDYCTALLTPKDPGVLGNFTRLGGLDAVASSLAKGHIISWALWTSSSGDFANWLDAGERGPCNVTEGDLNVIIAQSPDTMVQYSDIRTGDLGTTYTDKVKTS